MNSGKDISAEKIARRKHDRWGPISQLTISGQIPPRNPLAHEQTEMAAVGRQLAEVTRRRTAQSLNSEQLRRRHHARKRLGLVKRRDLKRC
jgi:hypothetical protein